MWIHKYPCGIIVWNRTHYILGYIAMKPRPIIKPITLAAAIHRLRLAKGPFGKSKPVV